MTSAWLLKLVLEQVAGDGRPGTVAGLVGGLAATGVAVGVLPYLTQYLRAELDRQVGLLARDRLFAAVDRFAGLARFEALPADAG